MIKNDTHLKVAQEAVHNLQQVLLAARKVHRAAEYRAMSEPILLEIQQREQEILEYLSRTEAEASLT
jgi:predicted methyltransferase